MSVIHSVKNNRAIVNATDKPRIMPFQTCLSRQGWGLGTVQQRTKVKATLTVPTALNAKFMADVKNANLTPKKLVDDGHDTTKAMRNENIANTL